MPNVGDLRVFTGSDWKTISLPAGKYDPVAADPETFGLPPMVTWDPPEDQKWDELLEVLLCSDCDMELGAPPCSVTHAYLADNPMQHRLLKPLLELYLKQARAEGKQCAACQVPIATGTCEHADVRDDQVTMSRVQWRSIIDDLGTLHGLRDRVDDLVEDRAAWAEDAVKKVAETSPWNGELHDVFLDDLRAEFRRDL